MIDFEKFDQIKKASYYSQNTKTDYKRLQTQTNIYSTATALPLSHICIVNYD